MIEQPTCEACGRPVFDMSYACTDCARTTRRDLETVALIAGEATTTIARLDHLDHRGGRHTEDDEPEPKAASALLATALPVNLNAAAHHDDAVNQLATWARHIHETSGRPLPTVRTIACHHRTCSEHRDAVTPQPLLGPLCPDWEAPQHPLAVAATWLARQIDWLRHRPYAVEALDAIGDAARTIIRTVDVRPDRWYAGPCGTNGCTYELAPVAGAKTIRCPECGAEHDAAERREALLDQAEDQLAGAAWLAATLTRLGRPVTANAIRKWADRGRLLAHAHDAAGRPLYRLGDVRALVLEAARREIERQVAAAKKAIAEAHAAAAKTTDPQEMMTA